jgi:hypothetical protein
MSSCTSCPNLRTPQAQVTASDSGWLARIERHVWMLSLAGLPVFYGLERSRRVEGFGRIHDHHGSANSGIFLNFHMNLFAVYNLLSDICCLAAKSRRKHLRFSSCLLDCTLSSRTSAYR